MDGAKGEVRLPAGGLAEMAGEKVEGRCPVKEDGNNEAFYARRKWTTAHRARGEAGVLKYGL